MKASKTETVLQHTVLCWEPPDLALWLNPYISQLIQHGWCALIDIVQGQGWKVWEELIIIDKKQFLGLRNHCISLTMVNFRKQAQFLPFVLNFVLESGSIKIINAMLILLQVMPLTCQVHFINFNKL